MATESSTTTLFRAKVSGMKEWKPLNPPSNRDRLELYALHKQAVSGDAPARLNTAQQQQQSVGERAKFNAWKSKRGLKQDEAMTAYITECDRQMRVYGTAAASVDTSTSGGAAADSGKNNSTGATTAASASSSTRISSTSTMPRGIAAIPLLCVAAAENKDTYSARMLRTNPSESWWGKQEPLCAEPGSAFALPETIVLHVANQVEHVILGAPLEPKNLLAAVWPVHNVLICIWIAFIHVCTLIGSAVLASKIIFLGKKRVGISLEDLFQDTVVPLGTSASTLSKSHPRQATGVRVIGLALMPLSWICKISANLADGTIAVGAIFYAWAVMMSWFYWLSVIPWSAVGAVWVGAVVGICFGIIEIAGV
eukprot:CAMPEP_0116035678 /NCGR_PEP_ID=MMETSP0321-20121206/20553_1 /TAXON_ID=163516 /ORGANISM="Leptocylindrus danicus var. danicus, Strain B650" /LENGTH=366 /DNA_ID=CAMNT_0003512641 /DNA_START=51 /DNA_END=1151 /DNA_ORIENTATION=-